MKIRPAKREDAPDIARFIAMAEEEVIRFFAGSDDPEIGRKKIEEYVLASAPNRYGLDCCLVAELKGRAIGMIMTFPTDSQPELDKPMLEDLHRRGIDLEQLTLEGEAGTFYLSTMGVDPDVRGKGTGSALLKAGMRRGREMGFSRASLLVAKAKPRAKALYTRLGFAVTGEVSMAGTTYQRMTRDISAV